jgi:CRP/FNR family transcriptional regulator, cyclic AMP receptor protein
VAGHDRIDALTLAIEHEPLPKALCDEFLRRAHLQRIRKDQMVVGEGTDANEVYLIQSGRVQFSLVSIHGRELILRDFGPGHIFGELAAIDGLPRSASAVALEDCQLARMSGPAFVSFLGEVPRAGLWMAQQLARRVRDLTNRTFELATLPVAARLQTELLRLALAGENPAPDRAIIRPLPTHADLAARIGTRREAVSRELSILAHEGLVMQSGRSLEILSVARLRTLLDRLSR